MCYLTSRVLSRTVVVNAGISCAVFLATALGVVAASASPLDEGSVLPNYAVVSVGPNSSIMVNSGPITGNVLLGDGNTSSSSGGGNGQVTGHVDVSPPATGDFLAHIQNPPTIMTVPSSVGTTAFQDANALSSAASALTPTQTFASITGTTTITGNGGLNVIGVGSLSNPRLTLSGGPNDLFVFNVSGSFQTNQAMTLNGVPAANILFNFTGTSGNVFQTSGGDVLFGTFLATEGGNFQFSGLNLSGQLINTGGHIQLVSNSTMPFFTPLPRVPEPSSIALLATGLATMWSWRRHRRSKASE